MNKINELNQLLTEKWDHVKPLCNSLIMVLPALNWSVAASFIMLNTMMENKNVFTNFISFLRSCSHIACSGTTISEKKKKNRNISQTFVFAFHHIYDDKACGYTQQIFVGLQDVFKTCLEDVLKMSWSHLAKTSWRDLAKTSWRRLPRRLKDILQDVLKTCLEEMSWRHVLKTPWRYYGDKHNTYWGYLYTYLGITNDLTSLYFTDLYRTILRRIQNALIRTQ